MALNLEDKKAIVAQVSDIANQAISVVAADYRGLDVPQMTALRTKARESGVHLQVIRNTLARRAFKDTQYTCFEDDLVGPLVFGFSTDEPGAVAKLFKNFAKDNKELEVKALSVAGAYYDASKLDMVASLPSKEEALSMLARTLLAPATNLARTLNEVPTKLARALDDYGKTKQE